MVGSKVMAKSRTGLIKVVFGNSLMQKHNGPWLEAAYAVGGGTPHRRYVKVSIVFC
jgi:hypothetical protein